MHFHLMLKNIIYLNTIYFHTREEGEYKRNTNAYMSEKEHITQHISLHQSCKMN